MKHTLFQAKAYCLVADVDKAFQSDKKGTADENRLQWHFDAILERLKDSEDTGRLYIDLEKFYQNASFIIGLGNVSLTEQAKQAWRAYDQFHYDQVKPQLTVHGNTRLG